MMSFRKDDFEIYPNGNLRNVTIISTSNFKFTNLMILNIFIRVAIITFSVIAFS